MERLKLLVNLLSGTAVSQINVIGNTNLKDSNIQELYDKILSSEFQTDEAAATHFYPSSKYQKKYYSRLKRLLEDRLLNTLFFLDVRRPAFTDYDRARQTCQRQMTAVKLLFSHQQNQVAISLALKTFKKAVRFDLTEIALSLAQGIRKYYATMTGQKREYIRYNKYVKEYNKIWTYELLAEEYYFELTINYSASKSSQPEMLKKAIEYSEELKGKFPDVDSFNFRFISYLIFVIRYEIENDYNNTLIISKEAIEYFSSKKHITHKKVIFTFHFRMISCYIQLKENANAKATIMKCLTLTSKGEYNWYITLELEFLHALRLQNYQDAYEVYLKAFNHPKFKSQYPIIVERWKINEAFVHFLILKGKIKPTSEAEGKVFKINRFLNDVPKHGKDKRGVNVTILVLQILFLLEQKRYEDIFERIEPLRMYTSRYLRRNDTFRSNCFIKMLMQLPAGRFHKEAVKRKAAPYVAKLNSVPLDVANQAAELELIPYEQLWEYVMDVLDNKPR